MSASENLDKRVRTSVFIEQSLIDEARKYAKEHGAHMASVIRAALVVGLNELEQSSKRFRLKSNVMDAVAAREFAKAREALARMEEHARPITTQLKRDVSAAVARRDFEKARRALEHLELYVGARLGRDLEEDMDRLDDALDNGDFDSARQAIVRLEMVAGEKHGTPLTGESGA